MIVINIYNVSGYSLSELRVIFDSEVVPAISNKETLGDWPNFDAVWLAQQIVSELEKPKCWQNALLDPIRRIFNGVTIESQWPILVMKYQRIQRMKTRIEL